MNDMDAKTIGVLHAILTLASSEFARLHGTKMDGPRNDVERYLAEIDGLATDCLIGEEFYSSSDT